MAFIAPQAAPVVASAESSAPARPSRSARAAVILSENIPEYAQIAAEIVRRDANHVTVYSLSDSDNATRLVTEIERANPDRIIAVGLQAAIFARRIPSKAMVFCQVYNYQDHDLVSTMSKGVQLLPPFDLQLRAWRGLARNLRRIGVVTGPGHAELVAEMRRAATTFNADLTVRTVLSDQEALLAFKELVPNIEGLWLLPDNRVLSPGVLRELMSYSARHGTQVAAFSDKMLKSGALISLTSVPQDVVDRVLARFDDVDRDGRLRGPAMLGLTAVHTTVNDEVATLLGLKLPEDFAQSR